VERAESFIDKATCKKETEIEEAMYHAILDEQAKAVEVMRR